MADCGGESHYSEGWGGGGGGLQSGAAFSYGLGKIYGLIIVQITQVHGNQATRVFAAPLGHGVKSTGAPPGWTARMSKCQPAKCGCYCTVDLRTVSLA